MKYLYRKLTPEQQAEIVQYRRSQGHPWHTPPHPHEGARLFLLTGACFEHRPVMDTPHRRDEWQKKLIGGMESHDEWEVRAYVILPNHWHVLACVELEAFGRWLGRLNNGTSTQWNREDGTSGRKVWFRFADRAIRGDKHFFRSLNYIHSNPVKHRYVEWTRDWPWSSVCRYAEEVGGEKLDQWRREYPIDGFGDKWD